MFKIKFVFTFLLFFLCSSPQGLQAQTDPRIHWKEIETKDAFWLFDAKHQEVAEYYIMQFERAKAQVVPLFKETSRKMTILLVDNTDMSNGSAQVTPQPLITLFLVNPSTHSSIGEFQNQVYELLVHEYTHILNMEPVHGWIRPFYWVFGSTARPNMMLPRWYTEGLAVYTESALSENGGRLRSQYLESLSRALTLENKWKDYPLDELNDVQWDWLGGSRAYLFGGILWDNITREGGDEIIYKLNQNYSRRIPFLLTGPLKNHLGSDFNQQLERAYDYWNKRSLEQIQRIREKPTLDGKTVAAGENELVYAPSISPDGLWMAYITDNPEGDGHVMLTLRHPRHGFMGYEPKKILDSTEAQSLNWHPAATGFVFERIGRHKRFYRFYDLYFYDLKTNKSTRLTRGARAHQACFSPRGDKLYFLTNRAASKNIEVMDWQTKTTKTLYKAPLGDDLRHLSCIDKDNLLLVEQLPNKSPHLSRLSLADNSMKVVFEKYPVRFLKQTSKGTLISSRQTGVENLYLFENESLETAKAITNSLTRAFQGEIDPLDDSLYYSQSSAQGSRLLRMSGAQWESLDDLPPQVEPLFTPRREASQQATPRLPKGQKTTIQIGKRDGKQDIQEEQTTAREQAPKTQTSRDFRPWRYLYPNHWIPFVYLVDGGQLYQAMTSAGDPMGINNISLIGQWDTLTRKPGVSLSYLNNSTPLTLGGSVSDVYNYFFNDGSTLHFTNVQFLASYRLDNTAIGRNTNAGRLSFRWRYSGLNFNNQNYIRQGPQLEFNYSKLRSKANDISPSAGWRFDLGHREYLSNLGNIDYSESYTHLGSFWSSFTPKRHVFYLGINASYAPELSNSFFATSTLAGPFINPQITNTSFMQRGYPTGVFIARNIVNTNAEYRFPVASIFSGWTQPPFFIKNLQGSFVFDATSLDGLYSDSALRASRPADFGRWFTGYGIELESNVQVGFHVPVTFTLGLYYGEDLNSFGGFNTFFNIRL